MRCRWFPAPPCPPRVSLCSAGCWPRPFCMIRCRRGCSRTWGSGRRGCDGSSSWTSAIGSGQPRSRCVRIGPGSRSGTRPGTWRPSGTAVELAPAFVSLVGPRAWRAYRLLRAVEARHPGERHWYLSHLAVEPGSQGRGLGTALVRAGLELADAESVGAYLETANDANLAFYGRRGFSQVGMTNVPAGPPVWALWRNPR